MAQKQTNNQFLWELSIELDGNKYHARLANCILHTLQLGVFLAAGEDEIEIGEGELSDRVRKYVATAKKDWTSRDKCFPLRLTGDSVKLIQNHIPLDIQGVAVDKLSFKLSVLRVFAFGHEEHLKTLISEIDLNNPPDLDILHNNTIYPWGKPKDENDADNLNKGAFRSEHTGNTLSQESISGLSSLV